MRSDYRTWLQSQEYSANTISTQAAHASRLEQAYGDLAALFAEDRLESVAASLRYTKEDGRRGLPNPSKVVIAGGDPYNSLASFRSALGLYARFLQETSDSPSPLIQSVPTPRSFDRESRERIGLERDLQKALRREIEQLEHGLTIIDEGVERSVPSGFIDITARDASGAIVVIELKAGTADRTAIGQVLSYMGDIAEDDPTARVRGILVAHDFDGRAKSAARIIPDLILKSYAVRFIIEDPSN